MKPKMYSSIQWQQRFVTIQIRRVGGVSCLPLGFTLPYLVTVVKRKEGREDNQKSIQKIGRKGKRPAT